MRGYIGSGTGDMTKAEYDKDNDGVVDNAKSLNGVDGATISTNISTLQADVDILQTESLVYNNEIGTLQNDVKNLYAGTNVRAGDGVNLVKGQDYVQINLLSSVTNHGDFVQTKNANWDCYTSASGLRFCQLELDYDATWNSGTSYYLGGKLAGRTYAENFPIDLFKTIIYCQPTIMTFATGYSNLRFRPYLKTMYSSVYTGDWNIVAAPTDDNFTNLPTSIHIVWSVIGF